MFNGLFISTTSGVGKESGNPWYRIELIADTIDGKNKVLSDFCSECAFRQAQSIEPMQRVRVICGVTANGHLTINAIKGEA